MTPEDIKHMSTEELERQVKLLDLEQNAVKLLINAYYGASGSNFFYFYNPTIAQSITLQGQDLIKFSIQAMNHFFKNKWHLDKELHEKLGISQYEIKQITEDVVIYVDTDSNFVWYEPAILSIKDFPEMSDDEALEFCLKIDEYGVKPYLVRAFQKYAEKFNTINRQDFELENASQEGIWLAKKNYIINVSYVDNEKRQLLDAAKRYQVTKGLEYVKGQWPKWAREKLLTLYNVLLKYGKKINVDENLIPLMKEMYEEYVSLPIDTIAFNFNLNNLDKYVIDLDKLEFAKGIPIIPRGTSYHNYLIRKTKNQRYREVTPGQKVKQYFCDPTTNENGFDLFCYAPGEFPDEIAPEIDKKQQFVRLIIDPINRFLEAFKMVPLDGDFKRIVKVVKSTGKKPIKGEKYFPLYAINKVTLDHVEIPERFNKYFVTPANVVTETPLNYTTDVDPADFGEYLSIISMYDLNTEIVPNIKLQKYIEAKRKKQQKDNDKKLAEFDDDEDEEGRADRQQWNDSADESEE